MSTDCQRRSQSFCNNFVSYYKLKGALLTVFNKKCILAFSFATLKKTRAVKLEA